MQESKRKSVDIASKEIRKIETDRKRMSFRFSNHVLLDCVNSDLGFCNT